MYSLIYAYFEKQILKRHLNYNGWLLLFKKQQDRIVLVQLKLLDIKVPLAQKRGKMAFIFGAPFTVN